MLLRLAFAIGLASSLVACGGRPPTANTTPLESSSIVPEVWQTGPGVDHWRKFTSYEGGPQPLSLTADKSGNVYYLTGKGLNKMNYSGSVVGQYVLPEVASNGGAGQVTFGNDGYVWAAVGDLFRVSSAGSYTKYTALSQTEYVTPGVSTDIWYTGNAVYHLNPQTGTTQRYPLPPGETEAGAIVLGPDKNIWFITAGAINQLNPNTGVIRSFANAGIGKETYAFPRFSWDALAVGPDANVWVLSAAPSPEMYRVTTSGAISGPYAVGGLSAYPQIAVADGYLWVNGTVYVDYLQFPDILFRVDTAGHATQILPPNITFFNNGGIPGGIAAGSDGNLWFNTTDIGTYILLPIVVKPYAVTMTHGSDVNLSVSQAPYPGPWTAGSTQPTIVRVVKWLTANVVQITGIAPGASRVIIRDYRNNYYDVPVTVK